MKARLVIGITVAVLVGVLEVGSAAPAAAEVACENFSSNAGQCVNTQLEVGGTSWNVDWYVPNGEAAGLVLLQHGFARGCGNLRNTSTAVMEQDLMVLCLNAPMAGGNPQLANQLGDALAARTIAPPLGRPLPSAIVVGGFSAGGHFASAVGANLAAHGDPALRGAVLLDPVASAGFSANLQAISGGGARPVLSVAARPSLANLYNNSFGALRDLPDRFVGIQLVWTGYWFGLPYGGSCHTDAEGENGDLPGNVAAGCIPNPTQVARLRDFAATWAHDLATGNRTAAHWCTNEAVPATCGNKITTLTTGSRPVAATIPTSSLT